MSHSLRNAALAFLLMLCAGIGAVVLKPKPLTAESDQFQLEQLVPPHFGAWRTVPTAVQLVNPQTQELLDKLYSQMLSRTYVNDRGDHIMLSMAFGNDQRGGLQAHMPEVCYPAQGFSLVGAKRQAVVTTASGGLPVRRLHARLGARDEPISYWFTFGAQPLSSDSPWERRMIELRLGLSGSVPNGMLVRVSSISANTLAAYETHDAFIRDLIASLSVHQRSFVVGI